MPPLIFYFPYPTVGGASVLFVRLAQVLSKFTDCTLIDLPNGFMAQNCPVRVHLRSVSDVKGLPIDGILITQTCAPWRISRIEEFPRSMRVFFWNLHPDNLSAAIVGGKSGYIAARLLEPLNPLLSYSRKSKLKKFLQLALEHEGIAFMDSMNADKTIKSLGLNFSPKLLPICSGNSPGLTGLPKSSELSCAWLGRLESFKTPVLIHLIRRLDAIASIPVTLNILGDGLDLNKIKEIASTLSRLQCKLLGSVKMEDIDSALVDHDVLFAMGTSALEGARLGIPTICVDYSYYPIEGLLRFRLLDEVKGFNLAEEIGPQHLEQRSSIESLLAEIKSNRSVFARRCFDYWKQHHSPDMVAKAFIDLTLRSSLTIGNICDSRLSSPDLMTRIRSAVYAPYPIDGWSYF